MAAVFDHKFTSRSFSTGVPTTLAGSPVCSVYKDNNTTQTTTGVTLTVDFDGVAGLNNVNVDTANAFYAAGSNFDVVITTGTVGGVSVVGEVIYSFSIEARSALMPTVANTRLDVSATGEAGIDLANVGSPTTVVNLSGVTIKTSTDVATQATDIQARIPAALTANGNIKADALRVNGTAQTAGDLSAQVAAAKTVVDTILVDSNELQVDWTNGGRLDLLIDAIKVVTDLLTAAQAEPTGVPAANGTPLNKLGVIYASLRNQLTVSATKKTYFDDSGVAQWEKDLTDDGTTYTENEGNAIG